MSRKGILKPGVTAPETVLVFSVYLTEPAQLRGLRTFIIPLKLGAVGEHVRSTWLMKHASEWVAGTVLEYARAYEPIFVNQPSSHVHGIISHIPLKVPSLVIPRTIRRA